MKDYIKYIVLFITLWVFPRESEAIPPAAVTACDTASVVYRLRTPGDDFLQQYHGDPAFNYIVKPREQVGWWQRLKWWILEHLFPDQTHRRIIWFDTLVKILAGAIVIFAIYKLIRSKYFFPVKNDAGMPENPEAMVGEVWSEPIYRQMVEQALEKNDFALALRIHYWYTLHLMDEQGIIHWDTHKTNRFYCYELKDKPWKAAFEKLTYIFDCVCYGEFEVSAFLYKQLETEFTAFRTNLKNEG